MWTLWRCEQGRIALSPEERGRLATAYGVPAEDLVPGRDRSAVRLDAGVLHVGGVGRSLGDHAADPDHVLGEYVDLVQQLRGLRRGDPMPLRDDDLDALAALLGDDPDEVERRLVDKLGLTAEEARRVRLLLWRRRLVVPVAGLAMGGALLNASDRLGDRGPTDPAPSTVEQVVEREPLVADLGPVVVPAAEAPESTTTTVPAPTAAARPAPTTTAAPTTVAPSDDPSAPVLGDGVSYENDSPPSRDDAPTDSGPNSRPVEDTAPAQS